MNKDQAQKLPHEFLQAIAISASGYRMTRGTSAGPGWYRKLCEALTYASEWTALDEAEQASTHIASPETLRDAA